MPDPTNRLYYGDNLDILRDRNYFPNALLIELYRLRDSVKMFYNRLRIFSARLGAAIERLPNETKK